MLGGDFNEVLSMDEVKGGHSLDRRAMHEFREMLNDLNLRDLGYSRLWYTWERHNNLSSRIR